MEVTVKIGDALVEKLLTDSRHKPEKADAILGSFFSFSRFSADLIGSDKQFDFFD